MVSVDTKEQVLVRTLRYHIQSDTQSSWFPNVSLPQFLKREGTLFRDSGQHISALQSCQQQVREN